MPDSFRDWRDLLPRELRLVCSDVLLRKVEQAHASPGRRYHSFQHVRACLELARQVPFDRTDRATLALLLHDVVYVPGRTDNEDRSAQMAAELLRSESRADAETIAAVTRMIRLTGHHAPEGAALSADEKRVLDIDLSVLGASWQGYLAYCGGVFAEYCPAAVDESVFRTGRRAFLERLLARKAIFLSRELHATYEAHARANIRREIDELLSSPGPLGTAIAMSLGTLLGLTR